MTIRHAVSRVSVLVCIASVGLALAQPARAQCSAATAERLEFLETRLEADQGYATWWRWGWLGVYGMGILVGSVQAGLEDGRDRANPIVTAVKGVIGTTRIALWPPNARLGADEMLAIPLATRADCQRRLEVGEQTLERNARQAAGRWGWTRHALNIGLNVAGGLIVSEAFDKPVTGWSSAGLGIAVGEANIFSHPWRAENDLEEYDRRFRGGSSVSWHLVPTLTGAAIQVRF